MMIKYNKTFDSGVGKVSVPGSLERTDEEYLHFRRYMLIGMKCITKAMPVFLVSFDYWKMCNNSLAERIRRCA